MSTGWSRFWTSVALLALIGLTYAIIRGSLDWHHFQDNAVETVGTVVERIHTETTDSYHDIVYDKYYLVVLFKANQEDAETWLRAEVSSQYYNSTCEGTQLAVRYLPDDSKVALLKGKDGWR